jgi:hypothetical protein
LAAEKGDGERVAARGCDGVDWRHGVGWVMRSKIGIDAHYATATKGFGIRRKQVSPAGSIAGLFSSGTRLPPRRPPMNVTDVVLELTLVPR